MTGLEKIVGRLKDAQDGACFTISDMATWFGVSRAAMSSWVTGSHEPALHTRRQLEIPLVLLERVVGSRAFGEKIPVPLSVRQYDRKDYIEKVKQDAIKEFSKIASAGGRVKMLGKH